MLVPPPPPALLLLLYGVLVLLLLLNILEYEKFFFSYGPLFCLRLVIEARL